MQAVATQASQLLPFNPNRCRDWWGYSEFNFQVESGVQLAAVEAMVDRLTQARHHFLSNKARLVSHWLVRLVVPACLYWRAERSVGLHRAVLQLDLAEFQTRMVGG